MTDNSAIMSIRGIARELGISEGAIRKAVKSGRVTGEMTLENVRHCLSSTQTQRAKVNIDYQPREKTESPKVKERDSSLPKAAGKKSMANNLNEASTLVEARTAREVIGAKYDELDLFVKEGKLADVEGMRRAEQQRGRFVHDAVFSIVPRIEAALAAESDVVRVRELLIESITGALNAAADAIEGES